MAKVLIVINMQNMYKDHIAASVVETVAGKVRHVLEDPENRVVFVNTEMPRNAAPPREREDKERLLDDLYDIVIHSRHHTYTEMTQAIVATPVIDRMRREYIGEHAVFELCGYDRDVQVAATAITLKVFIRDSRVIVRRRACATATRGVVSHSATFLKNCGVDVVV